MMASALIAARSPMLATFAYRFAPPRMDAADDRQKKIDAIFATGDDQDYLLNRDSLVSTEMDSSELLRRDEAADLWPAALSTDRDDQSAMLWVDELSCVGCRYCATIARSTFSMAEGDGDFGTARVTMQGGDDSEVIEEAIDVCPADCIHTCSRNELEILEEYRSLYLNELLAKWQARRLVSNGEEGGGGSAAPHWRDPLVNTGWQKGPKYVRSARLRMERPLLKDDV